MRIFFAATTLFLGACALRAPKNAASSEIPPDEAAKMSLEQRLEKASWARPVVLPVQDALSCEKLVFQEGRGGTNLRWVCEGGDRVADFALTAEFRKSRGESVHYAKTWAARGAFGVAPARGKERPGLYRVDLTSGSRKLLAAGVGLRDAALSPSGQLLVYASSKGLRAVPAKGGEVVALTENPEDRAPIFREDGKRLAWVRGSRKIQLWGADLTDRGSQGLTFEGANIMTPDVFEAFGGWVWIPATDQILASLGVSGPRRSLHLVGPAALKEFCLKRVSSGSDEEMLPAASASGRYVAWKRGAAILVAPYSNPSAPCDGGE